MSDRKRRDYFVVGPGPLAIRDWAGKPCTNYPVRGCYAVAWNDGHGPRLLDGNCWHSREDAERNAARGDGD
jgi:hypothetical protein